MTHRTSGPPVFFAAIDGCKYPHFSHCDIDWVVQLYPIGREPDRYCMCELGYRTIYFVERLPRRRSPGNELCYHSLPLPPSHLISLKLRGPPDAADGLIRGKPKIPRVKTYIRSPKELQESQFQPYDGSKIKSEFVFSSGPLVEIVMMENRVDWVLTNSSSESFQKVKNCLRCPGFNH